MASFADLGIRYRLFMRTYRYRTYDWSPGVRLRKPLPESKLAVVTTAAFYLASQASFDESVKGGDVSYRMIPRNTDLTQLQIGHRSSAFDPSGITADRNVAFPLDRLREMEEENRIGCLNSRHFSFMGSITAPGSLIAHSAPSVATQLVEDKVDAVLLTPI
jgi:D-proline reductase (dithiol) PrdB